MAGSTTLMRAAPSTRVVNSIIALTFPPIADLMTASAINSAFVLPCGSSGFTSPSLSRYACERTLYLGRPPGLPETPGLNSLPLLGCGLDMRRFSQNRWS